MGRVTVLLGLMVLLLVPGCRDRGESAERAVDAATAPPPPEPPSPPAGICAAYAACCSDYTRALAYQQLYEEEDRGATRDSCAAVAKLQDLPGGTVACERAFTDLRRAIAPMDRLEGWAAPDSCR